MLMTRTLITTV